MAEEESMRALTPVVSSLALLAACSTTFTGTSSPTVSRWEGKGRDISELITAIGPYDTTSVKGDWRSYDWFRFSTCHLTARTTLEGKIQEVTLEGVGNGCNVYLDKLSKS